MVTLMMMMMDEFRHIWDPGWGGGWGGDDDDIVTQTPRTISRRAVVLVIYSTFVMSDHLIQSPDILLDFATRPWDFGGLSARTRTWMGGSLFRGG